MMHFLGVQCDAPKLHYTSQFFAVFRFTRSKLFRFVLYHCSNYQSSARVLKALVHHELWQPGSRVVENNTTRPGRYVFDAISQSTSVYWETPRTYEPDALLDTREMAWAD